VSCPFPTVTLVLLVLGGFFVFFYWLLWVCFCPYHSDTASGKDIFMRHAAFAYLHENQIEVCFETVFGTLMLLLISLVASLSCQSVSVIVSTLTVSCLERLILQRHSIRTTQTNCIESAIKCRPPNH